MDFIDYISLIAVVIGLFFIVLVFARRRNPRFVINEKTMRNLRVEGVPEDILKQLETIMGGEYKGVGAFLEAIHRNVGKKKAKPHQDMILKYARKRLFWKPKARLPKQQRSLFQRIGGFLPTARDQRELDQRLLQELKAVLDEHASFLEEHAERLSQHDMAIQRLQERVGLSESLSERQERDQGTPMNRGRLGQEYAERRSDRSPTALRGQVQTENPADEFCKLYNEGVENLAARERFRKMYEPIRIGLSNAMQRRKDSRIDPEFQVANDGDYMGVSIQNYRRADYAVFPRFDLTFQESNYGPGAMGMVFQCENFDPQLRYRHVKVIKPAYFKERVDRRLELVERGALELGEGE